MSPSLLPVALAATAQGASAFVCERVGEPRLWAADRGRAANQLQDVFAAAFLDGPRPTQQHPDVVRADELRDVHLVMRVLSNAAHLEGGTALLVSMIFAVWGYVVEAP